ncbi:MAG: ABC transporter substrate-binding protein, partial [Anaerolineae bacterium]
MKRSLFSIIALLVVVSMIVTACGATEEPEATEAPEPTQAAEATEAPEATQPPTTGEGEQVSITVAGGNVGNELELTKAAAQRYMELHPNVTVNVLDTPDFVQDRLGLYLQFFEAQSSEVDV